MTSVLVHLFHSIFQKLKNLIQRFLSINETERVLPGNFVFLPTMFIGEKNKLQLASRTKFVWPAASYITAFKYTPFVQILSVNHMSNNLKLEVTRNAYVTVIDRRRDYIGEYISPHACRYNYRAKGERFITLVISYTDKYFPKLIIIYYDCFVVQLVHRFQTPHYQASL